jgi:hypothetical protein
MRQQQDQLQRRLKEEMERKAKMEVCEPLITLPYVCRLIPWAFQWEFGPHLKGI